jgi:hypothetical protein
VEGFGYVYMTSIDTTSTLGLGLVRDYAAIKKLGAARLQGQLTVEFLKEVQVLGACRYANHSIYIGMLNLCL